MALRRSGGLGHNGRRFSTESDAIEEDKPQSRRRAAPAFARSDIQGGGAAGDVRFRPHSIPPVPTNVAEASWMTWLTVMARTVNLVVAGKMNATTTVTLVANAKTTVLTDGRIGKFSHVTLEPMTATAAAAAASGGLYIVPTKGSATIHHPAKPLGDQTFSVLIIS